MAACSSIFMKIAIAMWLCLFGLATLVRESNARPPWQIPNRGVFNESAECHTNDDLLDLCQRCAKLTKSPIAYSACCSTDIEARRWCNDYVYFGREENDYYTSSPLDR